MLELMEALAVKSRVLRQPLPLTVESMKKLFQQIPIDCREPTHQRLMWTSS